MKKILSSILIFATTLFFFPHDVFAANSHSGSFTVTQYSKVENAMGWTGGNITVCLWVQPTALPSSGGQNQKGWFQISNGTTDVDMRIIYHTDDDTNFNFRVGRGKHGVGVQQVNYLIGDIRNIWTHLCLTYDTTNLKGYTASAGGTHTERSSVAASGDGLADQAWDGVTINGWSGADQSTYAAPGQLNTGLIDDVRIYNTVLSTADMDADFETELVGNETGLIAYYKFNNDWEDTTANAYHLTAVNSPTFSATVPFTGVAAATTRNDDDIYIEWFMANN